MTKPDTRRALVITTINPPSEGVKKLSAALQDWELIIVADRKTPGNWHCEGTRLISIEDQASHPSELASLLPFDHYSRKNIGYLVAMEDGCTTIAETDDDNLPYDTFLSDVDETAEGDTVHGNPWVNAYRYFTEERVWPRGFPLEEVNKSLGRPPPRGPRSSQVCPVQQFLADGDPDVDSVFRMTHQGETFFSTGTIILEKGSYCPFNSQNTLWNERAFPLMYLPSHVSFRMTDIWRSFVGQACLHAADLSIAFHGPTVLQSRNVHSLLEDFIDEVPGYVANGRIVRALTALDLSPEETDIGANMRRCYERLVQEKVVIEAELTLLDAWLRDVERARGVS